VHRLVAYYVEPTGSSPNDDQLRAILAEDLPEYMIPTAWMRLDRLPVSPNGKLDRAALPKPEPLAVTEAEFAAPQTPTEIRLAKIWADVLHLSRVSVTMDLLKLGADSIQLFQMIARSSREGFRVSAKQLLQHRTVRAVSALLDGSLESGAADTRSSLPTLGQFKRNRSAATQIKR
jgi:aryl carrier-like protein